MDPTNNQKVWAGSVSGGLFRSTDGAQSWSLITTAPIAPLSIQVDPHNYETWVGLDGFGLLRIGNQAHCHHRNPDRRLDLGCERHLGGCG